MFHVKHSRAPRLVCFSPPLPDLLSRLRDVLGEVTGGVLVAFSGGGDSVALLDGVARLSEEGALRGRVVAAHVHHGIRGAAADEDERFCRRFCEARGIAYRAAFVDARRAAREARTGAEDAARRLRYTALLSILEQERLCALLTAHQADDLAETMLLHLLRGCGGEGLRGIPARTPLPGGRLLLRPLLPFSREGLRDYCRARALSYREDETNANPAYARSDLRQNVLPALLAREPCLREKLARTAAILSSDEEYLSREAERAARLPTAMWAGLPDAILSRALQRAAREAIFFIYGQSSPPCPLPYRAITRLMALLREGEDARVSLPGGLDAVFSRGVLSFLPDTRLLPRAPLPLLQGGNRLPGLPVIALVGDACAPEGEPPLPLREILAKTSEKIYKVSLVCPVEFATITRMPAESEATGAGDPSPLAIRSPLPGERIMWRGKPRPLREVLRERGIPPAQRRCFPVLETPAGAILPGVSPRGEGGCRVTLWSHLPLF